MLQVVVTFVCSRQLKLVAGFGFSLRFPRPNPGTRLALIEGVQGSFSGENFMTKGISMLTGVGFCLAEEESINAPFWYLQFNGSEHGPFKLEELARLLSSGKLHGSLHFWRPGLSNWVPIQIHPQDRTP